MPLPKLFVEGPNDVGLISALLKRHGVDTKQGKEHLSIKAAGNDQSILELMTDAIKASRSLPVGFVIDIDTKVTNRWQAICDRLSSISLNPPSVFPADGFIQQMPDYPSPFGIWLMPDCKTDGKKLEDLVSTLIPPDHPLWPHSRECTESAAQIFDESIWSDGISGRKGKRYSNTDRIKAELHCWLAWQNEPGLTFGAAVNNRILGHDSAEALQFLKWVRTLFDF